MSLKKDLNRFTPRKEQIDCLNFVEKVKKEKPDTKFFLLNLPVGSGKSHLAMMISDFYTTHIDKSARVDIVTAGKILQDQYQDEYQSINNLKGKENYECHQYACACSQGKEFNRLNKTKCEFCPFDDARSGWITGKVSLTNFYLYLIYSIYNEKITESRDSKVLIVDECHELDAVISDFISIKITESTIKKLKFTNEKKVITALKKVTGISEYISFLKFLKKEIDETYNQITSQLEEPGRTPLSDKRENKISKVLGSKNPDVKLMGILTDLSNYSIKIKLFLEEFEENPNNWVLETYYNEKTKQKELSLEPIWSHDYLNKYLWSRYDTVILMSGTILNKELFCEVNGIDSSKAVYYSIPSPFDVNKRKIFYMPLGKMSWEKKEETFKNYLEVIPKILKKYNDKKGLIHTNSFELSNWIQSGLKDKRLVFHDSDNKNEVLQEHYRVDKPTVIVSPSMSTGVSFDHDKARFQIVAKIPYPSLGSQKNKMRKQQNPAYYSWKTCAGVIQMCGRVVRSQTDWADTIIIDGSFGDVMKYSSHFLPNWFLSSIKRVDIKK